MKRSEELEGEVKELRYRKLGLTKKEECPHIFRRYTVRKTVGDFIKVRRIYKCIYCGTIITYTWSEHI